MADINNNKSAMVITGKVSRPAEMSTFGKGWKKAKFAVSIDREMYPIRCEAVFEMADIAASLAKGDSVLIGGALEHGEYNDKPYTRLCVNTILPLGNIDSFKVVTPSESAAPSATPSASSFTDIDDKDLPFN